MQKQPGQHCHCGSDLSRSHPTPVSPQSSLQLQGPSPTAREFPARAGRTLDGMRAPDVAAPPRQPQPHVGLLYPPPPTGPARRGVDVAATTTRAGGGRVRVGLGQRCQPQLVVFFFSVSPSWTRAPHPISLLHLHLRFPSISRFDRFFFPSIISPRFVSLLFCRLPFRLSPAGLSAARKPILFAGSFKKGNRIPESEQQGISAESVGSELVSLLLFFFYLNYSGLLGLFLYYYFTIFTGTQVSLVANVFLWLLNRGLCTLMLCGDWSCHNGFFLFWCRSWKCSDFLIGDIRWGLSLLPSELHAVPAVLPVKILYPSVLGSRN